VNPLISTAQLAAELGSPGLIVCDATLYLPGDTRVARTLYTVARLPGARCFDIDVIADIDSALPHMLPGISRFERMMSTLGIGNDSRVVFYDQHGLFSAARAWWMLRLFGHEHVAVLDGGLPKWQHEGRALESGEPSVPPLRPGEPHHPYRASLRARPLRGIGDLLENMSTQGELVLDARSGERFHARVAETRPGLRPGHMPGAVNLHYAELLTPEHTLLSPAALRERFARAGVAPETAVVTTCGSGVTAAVLTLGLVVAGLPEGALYDGSWAEWGGRTDTPIVAS
jgi:thiosulfate/3-mercaptopyruvate sulfurtransferase